VRLALLGLNFSDLVTDLVGGLADLLVPDFAAEWATALVTALVAVWT